MIEENIRILIENPLAKDAFYNPAMKIVRNLNVEIYKNYAKDGYKFLDLLASVGANSIRIKKDLPFIEVYANDVSKKAVELLKNNAKINEVQINILNYNAKNLHCYLKEKFEIIDIDPFGSPIKFFPYVLNFLSKKTLLSLTATDIATLSGRNSETCLMRYGIFCVKNDMEREIALRNLIHKTITFFSSFQYLPKIVFSYSDRHFAKVYLVLEKSSKKKIEKMLKENVGFISFCENCLNKKIGIHEKCEICNSSFKIIGPTYLGKLFDKNFVRKSLENTKYLDVKKIFTKALEDFSEDYTLPPISFNTHLIAKKFKKNVRSIEYLRNELKNLDIKASKSYLDPKSIRTFDYKSLREIFLNEV